VRGGGGYLVHFVNLTLMETLSLKMRTFNLVYKGIILNNKPLTEAAAKKEVANIIMNYGYKAQIVEI
jgi:hypothetical protein